MTEQVYRFTAREKLAEVVREVGMRRTVYASKVARGDWPKSKADKHIALMEAIAGDYREAAELADLFAPVMVRVPLEPTPGELRAVLAAINSKARGVLDEELSELWADILAALKRP